jgi:hypothetical protein
LRGERGNIIKQMAVVNSQCITDVSYEDLDSSNSIIPAYKRGRRRRKKEWRMREQEGLRKKGRRRREKGRKRQLQ